MARDIMKSYLTYWKPSRVKWNTPKHNRLNHTAGNLLKKIREGDRLYVMTFRAGIYYLLGRLIAKCTPVDQYYAEKCVREGPLWEAEYHVLASKPFCKVNPIPFSRTLAKVRFASGCRAGHQVGKLNGPQSVQQFRVIREIDPDSAESLDTLIGRIE